MSPSDRLMVGRRVGGSFVFYWFKSLINSSIITAKQSREIPREAPTLLPPEAAPILPPTFTPEVRWQALIEAVKLRAQRQSLEHGCYTEKAERADPVKSHYHGENWVPSIFEASRGACDWRKM